MSQKKKISNAIIITNLYLSLYLVTFLVITITTCHSESNGIVTVNNLKFSQPKYILENGFKPISSSMNFHDYTNDVFVKDEKFKSLKENKVIDSDVHKTQEPSTLEIVSGKTEPKLNTTKINDDDFSSLVLLSTGQPLDIIHGENKMDYIHKSDLILSSLEKILLNYVKDALSKDSYELFSGIRIEPDNSTKITDFNNNNNNNSFKKIDLENSDNNKLEFKSFDKAVTDQFEEFVDAHVLNINVPRAMETGRLFFFKGLKKMLWPIFLGVQIAKTILLALFLPSIIGSLGKIVGKGLSSISGFNHPSETVSDLDFKDNTYNFEQENKFNDNKFDYNNPQSEASTNHFSTQMYDAAMANNNVLSRFGMGDQKLTYVNTKMGSDTQMTLSKNNNFKIFQDIPASSLFLTNYDPFYSPLLSRLDGIFQQLGLVKGNESCREKLICLMYASPAKYAPYSNLISAQLSRELNELRKPTSDNPDILRFFKYMKAAKDGQDGVDCGVANKSCDSFKESENPAMLTTFNDINKLVQARKVN